MKANFKAKFEGALMCKKTNKNLVWYDFNPLRHNVFLDMPLFYKLSDLWNTFLSD